MNIISISLLSISLLSSQSNVQTPMIIPKPQELALKSGVFEFDERTKIVCKENLAEQAEQLQSYLRAIKPSLIPITRGNSNNSIHLSLDKRLASLGTEGYRLRVNPNRIEIVGYSPQGVFYGIQSLRQLLPADSFRAAMISKSWSVPCVDIQDSPRFSWRGAHLDVGRHFMPKEFVLKFLDMMALHKLNTFHWHLTEDQGWRIEIKKYPRLTEVGSVRKDTMLTYSPPTFTGKPHSGYYTQDDAREVVAYASKLGITVVPEIEMPGHAQAAIAAYPELGNTNKPIEVLTTWGVSDNVFNVKDSTINFLKDVLTEIMDIFPSKFIHIGGDECPKTQWKNSPEVQARMKELNLKDEHEMQSWFIRQIDQFVASKGRRIVGWSEILEGGLAPGATLMVWLGTDGALTAARSGHDVVMAQTSHTYFDYYPTKNKAGEPHAIGGYLPLKQVYSYEPIPADLKPDEKKHILGCQFQLWTEYMHNAKHVEYMAFPRACALAEVAWTQPQNRGYEDFLKRLDAHLPRLKALDVNYRKPKSDD